MYVIFTDLADKTKIDLTLEKNLYLCVCVLNCFILNFKNLKLLVTKIMILTNSWKYFLSFRYRHEIACYENRIFVLGGGTSQRVYSLDVIYVYSIDDNKWFLRKAKPDRYNKGNIETADLAIYSNSLLYATTSGILLFSSSNYYV